MKQATTIYLTEELRQKLHILKEEQGITMSGVITAALMQYIRREGL